MSNICKASTEDDKHQLASIPLSLPPLVPSCLTTRHRFSYSNPVIGDTNTQPAGFVRRNVNGPNVPGVIACKILRLGLNDCFRPIHGVYRTYASTAVPTDVYGYTESPSGVFTNDFPAGSQYNIPRYYPQGINQYARMFKYYKVKSSTWHVTIRNIASFDNVIPTAGVRICTYLQNNELVGELPYPFGTAVGYNGDGTRALYSNPRVGWLGGGAILGQYGLKAVTGIADTAVSVSGESEISTSFKFVNSQSVSSDPANTQNVQYWTLTGAGAAPVTPQSPINTQDLYFAAVFATPSSVDSNLIKATLQIEVTCDFEIDWRDHTGTDPIFTDLTRVTNN